MALTYSEDLALGTPPPAFDLAVANAATLGRERVRLQDFVGAKALVVVFTCNHCPYAKHIEDALVDVARRLAAEGASFVAISSNDADTYPQDGFDRMAERAEAKGFPFPYAFDADQSVARAYHAVCTPDLYVFDAELRLAYHGRFDDTRPNAGRAHGSDLERAVRAVLEGKAVPEPQIPSVGCNIKWKS